MDSTGWAIFFTVIVMILILACFILSFFSFRFLTEVDEIHTKREKRTSTKGGLGNGAYMGGSNEMSSFMNKSIVNGKGSPLKDKSSSQKGPAPGINES